MKTKIKKTIALTSALLCFGVQATTFNASVALPSESGIVSPRYIIITEMDNEFYAVDGGLECVGKTAVPTGYKAEVKVELQRLNRNWITIKSWTSTSNIEAKVAEVYSPASGYSYQLKTTHSAYDANDNLIESYVYYSDIVNY